jgi:hypothetical protein
LKTLATTILALLKKEALAGAGPGVVSRQRGVEADPIFGGGAQQ